MKSKLQANMHAENYKQALIIVVLNCCHILSNIAVEFSLDLHAN